MVVKRKNKLPECSTGPLCLGTLRATMWRLQQRLAHAPAPLPWDAGEGVMRPGSSVHKALINFRAHYREGSWRGGSPLPAEGRVMSHWKYSTLG